MNNIPLYFSSGGTATLILREIPYSGRAFILIRTLLEDGLSALMEETRRFCMECGAKTCYISYADAPKALPLRHAYDILKLHIHKEELPSDLSLSLIPMTTENEREYMNIYNVCFQGSSHAMTYDYGQLQRIYRSGQKAFLAAMPDGSICGIGELHDNELAAIALLPEFRGNGRHLALALMQHCPGPEITLTVSSDNDAALALYDKLGFRVYETESSWYFLP